jgi:hypothetical protein
LDFSDPLIAIIVIILAVIGLGAGAFFLGVMREANIVWNSPAVQNVTQDVKEFVQNNTGEGEGGGR